ncbi:hypothetical protein Tco_0870459 [Tanacetum coccineum]
MANKIAKSVKIDESIPLPLQDPLRPAQKKRKMMDLELEVYIVGLHCNRSRKGAIMSTQEYMKNVVEDVGKDEDFKSGSWVSATDYVNANGGIVNGCLGNIKNFLNNGKLDQVVEIDKSCSLNMIGDLTVTMKDLSSTIPGTIHHKVVDEGGMESILL